MKISLNWLQDYVALDAPVEEICRAVTFLGFEVEQVIRTGAPRLEQVVVGEVLVRDKHPNADKLSVCQVDVGPAGGVKTIVCGAQNYKVGDRVPVALPGAVLPGNFVIKRSKIRGQESEGMMCSAKELGIAEDADGLLILAARPDLGVPINQVLPSGDVVLDIEITPNRPDCLSHLGIARELAAWFRKDLVYPQEKFRGVPTAPARPDLLRSVTVSAPGDCPLYTAHVITGIRIGPSPAWLQDRLRAVGLRPINNVVDVGNYVMLETGQPLHAFDARRLAGAEIHVRRAAAGEAITTLDGKERKLGEDMLVIADAGQPVVVAGIMGGAASGVVDDTTDLVLECAAFRRQAVRATSKRLGLASDSSYRYERGVDPHGTLEAAWRAIDLILETAGGQVAGPGWKVGGDVPWNREIVLTPSFVRERLGFDIPDAEMKASLELLELTVTREEQTLDRGPAWTVSIPSWRDDLDRPIDLVEEVLRLYGTEKIPSVTPVAPGLVVEDAPVAIFNRKVTDYLVGQDFHECLNYTLRSDREVLAWSEPGAVSAAALSNPFVEDQSNLRSSLIPGLLESLKLNQSRGVELERLCETGRVFLEREGRVSECVAVGFIIAENPGARTWLRRSAPDFYSAKHLVEVLSAAAGVNLGKEARNLNPGAAPGWQSGHAASISRIERGWFAQFGLLDLATVRAAGVEGKVYAGQFVILPESLGARESRPRYADFSLFPSALRDLALLVDEARPAGEIRQLILTAARTAAGSSLAVEDVRVFDLYRGAGVPEGKKSLAYSIVFRAANRTLTDDEVNGIFIGIQAKIVTDAGIQIRK
jgi:phenylalanyl-tRNA synthetase beta chain